MNCVDVRARLHPYVDGELSVSEIAAVDAHATECRACAVLIQRGREFRLLLRRQPRETTPPELRATIVARLRRESRVAKARPWLLVPGLVAAAAVAVFVLLPASRPPSPLVPELVAKHIAYAQIERPAELASTDGDEVAQWFLARAGMRVTVPDYSPSGIQLIGARLAEAHEQRTAYLLYEKGRTLLSVFMVPVAPGERALGGRRVAFRGQQYMTFEEKGFRTVSWTDGQTLYGLVSMLDYGALLECADRLRAERTRQTRL